MSGYANWLLSAILLIGAAIGSFFGLFQWIKTQQQIPQSRLSRFAAAWRHRLIPIMLACMGVAGAILIIGAIFGAMAYSRQSSDETMSWNGARQEIAAAPRPTKQILATYPLDPAFLTPARKDEFYRAIHSVDNLGVNFSGKVSIIAEEGGAPFARELVNLFIAASWQPEDHGGNGEYVGAPVGYRLLPGVTISAPIPSGAAEAARTAFERIGVSTRRKTDRSRADDYLIVEIGPN